MRAFVLVLCVSLGGCSADMGEEFTCNLDSLSGTWRASYAEIDGTCGPFSDETVNFSSMEAPAGCEHHVNDLSADKCRRETDFECVFDEGYTRQVAVLDQISPTDLIGTLTITIDVTEGFCRGTYDIEMTKL